MRKYKSLSDIVTRMLLASLMRFLESVDSQEDLKGNFPKCDDRIEQFLMNYNQIGGLSIVLYTKSTCLFEAVTAICYFELNQCHFKINPDKSE
ncbi:hypothetical protein CDAR_71781 [Caerostris darwini]|uniref:Uncharacterized protein n=1 Tax=Caerostris darwini TaxID=1538125 RepID=A0AAV4TGK7_9ARAC|nr:hypothetical protein CDAR_71781 [Caerostris darwini]